MFTFDTQVNDTPCRCMVLFYRPHVPAKLYGAMEDAEEDIPSEFQYALFDFEDNALPDLEAQATPADDERLQDEYEAAYTAAKHGKEF